MLKEYKFSNYMYTDDIDYKVAVYDNLRWAYIIVGHVPKIHVQGGLSFELISIKKKKMNRSLHKPILNIILSLHH